MFPEKCIEDINRVIEEQQSKRILFISDEKENSNALYNALKEKNNKQVSLYAGEDITSSWDMIIISDFYVVKDVLFINTLKELLQYINHSLLVISGTYLDKNGDITNCTGTRFLHPVRFCEFDFSYQTYEAEGIWSIYNFYPTEVMLTERTVLKENIRNENKKLNVLYALPHRLLTGGVKCLLTHARRLYRRGHNVYLMHSGHKTAIPEWSDVIEGEDITGQIVAVDARETAYDILYNKKIDVIIVGYYTQIEQFIDLKLPILYWEQGHEELYGDFRAIESYNNPKRIGIRSKYQLPVSIAAVSPFLSAILKARFGCNASLLHTGIDTDVYHPCAEKSLLNSQNPKILLVGNPFLPFKNFSYLLTALSYIWKKGYRFTVTWACQSEPEVVVPFPIEYKVQVPQSELAELYRIHDIYINTSIYEASPMPPLEAMASGTAVIATDCGGIHTYAIPGENMILTEQGNFNDLLAAIIYLLENPSAREVLAEKGRRTALEFSVGKAIDQLENLLYHTIEEHYRLNKEM